MEPVTYGDLEETIIHMIKSSIEHIAKLTNILSVRRVSNCLFEKIDVR